MNGVRPAGRELILGAVRSGKSRAAERRAAAWLAGAPGREAVLVATAVAGDAEMTERIARHRAQRAARVPALVTREVHGDLPRALAELGAPRRLLVVDCLTLWLTQCLLPIAGEGFTHADWEREQCALVGALAAAPGPVVLVSNEIGLGVMLAPEARRCIDALGVLHQHVAAQCSRVTWMVAGIGLTVKDER